MAKSAEAFRTISEASKELEVPQHVLRHWEDVFGHIRPMRRAGGRRYYRPIDLDLLRGVRTLLYDERYTTKGVQKIFREHGAKYVTEIGRKVEAGEPLDLRSENEEEEGRLETVVSCETSSDTDIKENTVEYHDRLKALIARLETVQDSLDDVITDLDAISLGDDETSED